MRCSLAVLGSLILLIGSSVSLAADGAGSPAATQPARPDSLLILPFRNLSAPGQGDWIASSIQQTLAADLTRWRSVPVRLPSTPPTTQPALGVLDPAAAARLARDAGADAVVFGTYQLMDNSQVQINGHVVSAHSGQVLGSIRAEGSTQRLPGLSEDLATQVQVVAGHTSPLGADYRLADLRRPGPATQPHASMPSYVDANGVPYDIDLYPSYASYPPTYVGPRLYTSPTVSYNYPTPLYRYSSYYDYPDYPYYGYPYFSSISPFTPYNDYWLFRRQFFNLDSGFGRDSIVIRNPDGGRVVIKDPNRVNIHGDGPVILRQSPPRSSFASPMPPRRPLRNQPGAVRPSDRAAPAGARLGPSR